jgi:hypothetical protein
MSYTKWVSENGYIEDGKDYNVELSGRRTASYAIPTVNQSEFSPYISECDSKRRKVSCKGSAVNRGSLKHNTTYVTVGSLSVCDITWRLDESI